MNWLNLIFSGIVSAFVPILVVSNITNKRISFKEVLIFTLISMPLLIINYSIFDGITRLLLNIIIMITALYFSIFNKDISKSVYYTFIYESFVFSTEIFLTVLIKLFIPFDMNSYNGFSFSLLIFSILDSLFIYLISKIKFVKKGIVKLNNIISKNDKEWIYMVVVVILFACLLTVNKYNLDSNINFYVNFGMLIFTIVSLIYVISNKLSRQHFEDKYNQMMEYVCKYENIINEQGKKNHEYNNQLMVISGYADNPEKLKEYLKLVMEEHKVGQNYMVKQLGCFPNGGIKGLMYNKVGKIEECKIKPYFYIDPSIKDIFETKFDVNTYRDITKLLGVYLDNAIDAAKDASPKEIELEMKVEDNYLVITINNTYNKNVDVSKIGKKGFSTKGAGHGYGLSIVKDIAKNNDRIETYSEPDDKFYKQVIIIDLK